MIYVRRDSSLIPEKLMKVAERAQKRLEELPPEARPEFIKKKARIWHAFRRYLSKMSYGKCWYSESPDPQSFFDVDHYRPKLEARRSEDVTDPGYEWLAFSWENFRYSAPRSNRRSKNEETAETEGKGNWFPLLDGSPKASWDDRCEASERPVLLDPVVDSDVDLITVLADGRMGPSRICIGSARQRVERSIEFYGLNLPDLKAARLRAMRQVNDLLDVLARMVSAASDSTTVADRLPIDKQVRAIKRMTCPQSPYSRAVRAHLVDLGAADYCAKPEDLCEEK